ncbi:MAG TPA: hypothetical protein VD789_08225, partial [Thermomicrobiales bacterium]|nr:hypothetical protein [Thermomicrobiales bacterium]
LDGGTLTATVQAGGAGGQIHAFALDADGNVLGDQVLTVEAGGSVDVSVDVGDAASVTLVMSFVTEEGAVQAIATSVAP